VLNARQATWSIGQEQPDEKNEKKEKADRSQALFHGVEVFPALVGE
jgi:hypothetical protein